MSEWKCPDGHDIEGAVFIARRIVKVQPERLPNSDAFKNPEPSSSEYDDDEVDDEQETRNGFGLWACTEGDFYQENQLEGSPTFEIEVRVKVSVTATDGNLAEQAAIRNIEGALFQAGVDQDGVWVE